jgi:drug/metabolite transporter (DMT)-like permease
MDGKRQSTLRLIGWMLAAIGGYITFAVCVRLLRDSFSIFEMAAIRSVGALIFCAVLLARNPVILEDLRTVDAKFHILRSVLHAAGTLAIVASIALVPLGLVSALEFTGPLFAALFAFCLTGLVPTRLSWIGLAAIAAGAGALIWQNMGGVGPVLLLPLVGTATLAMTNILLARMAARHRTTSIMLTMASVQLPIYLAGALLWQGGLNFGPINSLESVAIFGIAITGFSTQMALANATRHGTDLQVNALDVLRIPAVVLVAYVFFAERLSLEANIQIATIMFGVCLLAFARRR